MAKPTYQQLLETIAQKDRQIAQLEAGIGQLEQRNAQPEARIVQLERLPEKSNRAGKRQATPFSKGMPKENPKKPGRKSGKKYGRKAHRPPPEQEPDEVIDVLLPRQCDQCGGHVQEEHIDQRYQVEIPPRPIAAASRQTGLQIVQWALPYMMPPLMRKSLWNSHLRLTFPVRPVRLEELGPAQGLPGRAGSDAAPASIGAASRTRRRS